MTRFQLQTLALLCSLPFAAQAQTFAEVTTERGCTAMAPEQLLMTAETDSWLVGDDRIGVIEIESVDPASGWSEETQFPGFTGESYYRWVGGDFFNTPGRGVMTYRFFAKEAGTYQVRIHNRHNHPDPSLQNDCWMSVNGSSWIKTYSNNGANAGIWTWDFQFDPGRFPVRYNLNRGLNEIRISGRSNGFMIDRLVVFNTVNGENTSIPESPRLAERPVIGSSFDLVLGRGAGAFNLSTSSTIATILWEPNRTVTCGRVIPDFGRSPGGRIRDAEFLLTQNRIRPLTALLPWNGNDISLQLDMPNDSSLVGLKFFVQAVMADVGSSQPPVLTPRLDFTIGDF